MLTKDMFLTIMTMIGGGVVACLAIFIFCCVRRRSCDTFYVSASEDLDLSSSHDNSVTEIAERAEKKITDETYFKRWVTRWHRSANETKNIICHVFSLKPDFLSEQDGIQTSPEYVAVPARLVEKLDPKELEQGSFSGDSAQQFRQIYRASRLSAKGRTEPAPGSPRRYQHSAVLRSKPMVHYFNPICCVEGQPSLQGPAEEEEAEGGGEGGTSQQKKLGRVCPTVTASSVENPLQHSRQSSINEIFTIYEDSSVVSADSLDRSPRQLHPDLERILSSTSPVMKRGAYSGFIKEQSLSPTKFAV